MTCERCKARDAVCRAKREIADDDWTAVCLECLDAMAATGETLHITGLEESDHA